MDPWPVAALALLCAGCASPASAPGAPAATTPAPPAASDAPVAGVEGATRHTTETYDVDLLVTFGAAGASFITQVVDFPARPANLTGGLVEAVLVLPVPNDAMRMRADVYNQAGAIAGATQATSSDVLSIPLAQAEWTGHPQVVLAADDGGSAIVTGKARVYITAFLDGPPPEGFTAVT
jgi:hypothetical protein